MSSLYFIEQGLGVLMKDKEGIKRLFFGIEVEVSWATNLPEGSLLREFDRHLTVDFLGNISWVILESILYRLSKPDLPLAPAEGPLIAVYLVPMDALY
ncbi:MAG: hypothetical protein ACI9YB_001468 [Halioglobus sp.]